MDGRSTLVAVALVIGALVAGCSGADRSTDAVRPDWQELALPVPAGPPGRTAVRDATSCGGQWVVVGAVLGPGGASRPAAWTSRDARTWRTLPTAGRDYYARRAILRSVACRDGRVVAVGARSGGAHGNPRTSTWYQRADGTLVDMRADWTLYGGTDAVSVNRVAAGPDGWLIDGNRRSGAAVWVSADGTDFRLVDDDPALSSDAATATTALDQVHDGTAWTVVGRVQGDGRPAPAPLAWTSPDGERWAREPVPASTSGFADLERVVRQDDRLVAAGLRDRRFGLWLRADGRWRAGPAFGALAADGEQAPFVSGLAAGDRHTLAAVSDGARFRLWTGTAQGTWREVAAPVRVRSTGDTQMTVTADHDTVLLLTDDGRAGQVWLAPWGDVTD